MKLCCLVSLERGHLCEIYDVSRILNDGEDLSCPCYELKRFCLLVEVLKRMRFGVKQKTCFPFVFYPSTHERPFSVLCFTLSFAEYTRR